MPALARAYPPGYVPGRPEETPLYPIVSEHLDEFLEHVESSYDAPLPAYVVDELRGYLECGRIRGGFLRCHCDHCGHDLLVAFSCKRRGACPSCAARRMCNEAAHLTDRVLPNVPVRQWVLSLPFELRPLAAFRPDVLSKLSSIFVEEIFAASRFRGGGREGGAVTFVQRFGGSLNLNVHFHDIVLDGHFVRENGAARFVPAPPPERSVIERVARRVHDRAIRWLRRKGLVDDRSPSERPSGGVETPLAACARVALFGGDLVDAGDAPPRRGAREPFDDRPKRFSAHYEGFDVHAAVTIAADDDDGRERLVRYCARPPLALDRLSRGPDGSVVYRVKYPSGRRTRRVMTPVEFLARLAALIPPPRHPLVRYHGVLAPHSKWRKDVVPKLSDEQRDRCAAHRTSAASKSKRDATGSRPMVQKPVVPAAKTPRAAPKSQSAGTPKDPLWQRVAPSAAVAHDVITVRHWGRLLDGALLATSPRVPWSELLRRTHGVDVLACPKCEGRLRVLAIVAEKETADRILDGLGVDSDSRPPARAPPKPAASRQLALPLRAD